MDSQFTSGSAIDREPIANTLLVTPDMSKLDAMRAYASIGWKTFLLSAGKVPVKNCDRCEREHVTAEQREACTCLTCHGFFAGTLDPDRHDAMVRRIPNGLVAVRTGAASGIVLIDIDTLDAHGRDGISTATNLIRDGYLPRTAAAVTASGGWHFPYAHPGGWVKSGANRLGPGVDVKGDGAYFVAAPSRNPRTGTPYRWIGDTLTLPLSPLDPRVLNHLRKQDTPVPAPRRPVTLPQFRDRYVTAAVAGEVQAIMDAPNGGKGHTGRNEQLNRSAFILGTLVGAGALDQAAAERALTDAACAVGLDHDHNCGPSQIARTIRSGMTAGMRHPRRLQGVR